ncbi:MAG: phospholipase D-like domain-containing protein [Chloroflexota bacterium]|nr:phospholipase D-like domain-containing protein [Chloroflexota bacterium]
MRSINRFAFILLTTVLFALMGCDSDSGGGVQPPASSTVNVPNSASVTPRPASATARPATATSRPATARPSTTIPTVSSGGLPAGVTTIPVGQGFGYRKGFWEVYFNAPTGSRDAATYRGGIDENLAAAIGGVQRTLDIAAFEFNVPSLTTAVLAAKARGVRVRVVTDDEHGIEDEDTTLGQLEAANIPIVNDNRSALMHNKFMILDSAVVWLGSWNYTINDTYRNNNNAIALRSRQAVENFQAEFDEMFVQGLFGPRSPSQTPNPFFTQDGIAIATFFAAEDNVIDAVNTTLTGAQRSIDFLAFSFTLDTMRDVILSRANAGVNVRGIFERTGSETEFSELRPLFCAGLPMRQDGGSFVLHHKVFIVDRQFVLAGSFNFSASASDSNDENLLIINDPDLAALYTQEFERRWAEARTPSLTC